jgi:Fe-S-cluster containining protein
MLFSLLSLLETKETPKRQATCVQCGQCCESFGGHLRASPHDLKRWREHGRQDLLDSANHLGWVWVDPVTKERVSPCPHIDRSDPEHVRCAIYADRPDMCRDYPTLAHGKRCLRGVFLGWWGSILIDTLPEWVVIFDALPLAA